MTEDVSSGEIKIYKDTEGGGGGTVYVRLTENLKHTTALCTKKKYLTHRKKQY